MFEQSRIVGSLLTRIGQQIAGANTQGQFNQGAKSVLNSEKLADALDRVNDGRVEEKMQEFKKDENNLDRVHISPEAQELYDRQLSAQNTPIEKIHGRKQMGLPQEPKISPEPPIPES